MTNRQSEFVHHLVMTGCTPTEAARAVGYAEPKQEAYRLTRLTPVQDAVRQERERLITSDLANVALRTLKEIMVDKTVAASARVSAARTACEVAGMFDKDGRSSGAHKPLQEMSADELADQIKRFDQALVQMAGNAAVN